MLDSESQSSWGWTQNSLVKIDEENKNVIYNHDYEVIKMISSNIKTGAFRAECVCLKRPATAFVNTDKSLVIAIANLINEDTQACVKIDRMESIAMLPANSVCILKYKLE